jgi:hypothetical protein
MTSEGVETPTLPRLLTVPGLAVLVVLGISILAASRLFGADTILREVVTEVIAGIGNAILVLALFGLFFRTGLERLLRRAPGGDALAESAQHLGEILGSLDQREEYLEGSRYEAKLERIDEGVRSLANDEIPALKSEMDALRKLILDGEQGRRTR